MCPDAPTLSAYFDGEISGLRAADIASHLEACPACRATLAVFERQRGLLLADTLCRLPSEEFSAEESRNQFWDYVAGSRVSRNREGRRISIPLPAAVAASVAFAASVLFNILPFGSAKPDTPDVIVLETRRQTPTVVSLTIMPEDLGEFLAAVNGVQPLSSNNTIHTLPEELPFVRLGEPQMGRPASFEGFR